MVRRRRIYKSPTRARLQKWFYNHMAFPAFPAFARFPPFPIAAVAGKRAAERGLYIVSLSSIYYYI